MKQSWKQAMKQDTCECIHCWHDTGKVLCSMPPQLVEVCCQCGLERTLRTAIMREPIDGHGPFFPKR